MLGTIWSGCNTLVLIAGLLLFDFHVFMFLALVVGVVLIVYYAVMWIAPYEKLHRRPAASSFALLNILLLFAQVIMIVVYIGSAERTNMKCAVELMFSITEFVQLAVMLYAFLQDSMFWQGNFQIWYLHCL